MAAKSMNATLTNFLYLRFAFTLQENLVPMLSESFTYILNRRSRICSLCPFGKTNIYIHIYIYI